MAAVRKHGYHRYPLDLPKLAVGAASDTSTLFTYDPFPGDLGTYDSSSEFVLSAALTCDAAVAGAATNNFAVTISHYNAAGTLVDQIVYTFAAGVNATAFLPIDLGGAVAGALTNPTGVTVQKGWTLQAGDSIVVARTSNGTGLASPAFTVTVGVGAKA
jgi:hypothetical protein